MISNNSWANSSTNQYTTSSQTFDKLVRDAVDYGDNSDYEPMTIVFAAANEGPSAGTVRAPATAKNVITVGSSNGWRKTSPPYTTSCGGVEQADDARDVTNDSSAGPTSDQRTKPDLVAPGTRITGSASRAVCDPTVFEECGYFLPELECQADPCCAECPEPMCGFVRDPEDLTRTYLMASGTSFAAPAVSGAAALVRKHFLNNEWDAPSPAMTKAYLLATTTYLTGDRANDTLPSNNQGYGRVNLGTAFDGTANLRVDQSWLFTSSGSTYTISGTVADSEKPFRVVLAWTDAPGSTSGAAYVNNLDLEVTFDEEPQALYLGNLFQGSESRCIDSVPGAPVPLCLGSGQGTADTRNNTEAVFRPAGAASGDFEVTVRAMTIAGDSLPGNGSSADQDFALFIYNATQ